MSQVSPNFGRTVYAEPVTVADDEQNVPENVQGVRRDATMLIVVSTIIAFVAPPLGAGGVIAGLLWLLSAQPAATTTDYMVDSKRAGDRNGGCFWYAATCIIGTVVFVAGLFIVGAFAMVGR